MSVQPTQNILESIISPKIVGDATGYSIKTDIQNVDNITTTGALLVGGTLGGNGSLMLSSDLDLNGNSIISGGDSINLEKLNISDNILSALPEYPSGPRPILLGSNLDLNTNSLFSSGGDIKIGVNNSDVTIINGSLTTKCLTLTTEQPANPNALTFTGKSDGSGINLAGTFTANTIQSNLNFNAPSIYSSGVISGGTGSFANANITNANIANANISGNVAFSSFQRGVGTIFNGTSTTTVNVSGFTDTGIVMITFLDNRYMVLHTFSSSENVYTNNYWVETGNNSFTVNLWYDVPSGGDDSTFAWFIVSMDGTSTS